MKSIVSQHFKIFQNADIFLSNLAVTSSLQSPLYSHPPLFLAFKTPTFFRYGVPISFRGVWIPQLWGWIHHGDSTPLAGLLCGMGSDEILTKVTWKQGKSRPSGKSLCSLSLVLQWRAHTCSCSSSVVTWGDMVSREIEGLQFLRMPLNCWISQTQSYHLTSRLLIMLDNKHPDPKEFELVLLLAAKYIPINISHTVRHVFLSKALSLLLGYRPDLIASSYGSLTSHRYSDCYINAINVFFSEFFIIYF